MLWQYRIVKRNHDKAPYGYQFKCDHWFWGLIDSWSAPIFGFESEEEIKNYIRKEMAWYQKRELEKKSKIKILEVMKP